VGECRTKLKLVFPKKMMEITPTHCSALPHLLEQQGWAHPGAWVGLGRSTREAQ